MLVALNLYVVFQGSFNDLSFQALPAVNVGIAIELWDPLSDIQCSNFPVQLPYIKCFSGKRQGRLTLFHTKCLFFLDFNSHFFDPIAV